MRHERLDCNVAAFLEARALEELGELRRHAMESRLESLQALAETANGEPAQHEILRLARVAEVAVKLESTTASAPIRRALRDIVTACEAATATMSASISAALLMIQHRVDQSEGLRREALENGQRRLSAAAAALVLPTLVIGVAGANFITPADD